MQIKSSILILLVGLVFGVLLNRQCAMQKNQRVTDATVLLEQVRAVCKVITVEGAFSELMVINEYQGPFPIFFDKKVIVRVMAKVSAGYDLNRMTIVTDEKARVLRISHLPKAEILSIDQQLSYYDISEGLFVSFSPDDYTRIQADARKKIEEAAQKSNLLNMTDAQAKTILGAIKTIVEQAGWTVESDFKL
jgi:hypothetical protein